MIGAGCTSLIKLCLATKKKIEIIVQLRNHRVLCSKSVLFKSKSNSRAVVFKDHFYYFN